MKCEITRSLNKNKFTYRITANDSWVGESNYTYGIGLRKLLVKNIEGNTIKLQQTKWFYKMLDFVPLLNKEMLVPFCYFENDLECGKTKTKLFSPVFWIDVQDEQYELRQHNDNYCSLMRNDAQIALYKKKDWTCLERNKYEVIYLDSFDEYIQLLLLFCIFADIAFYSNDNEVYAQKYEKGVVFNDPYSARTLWSPREA